MTLVAFFKDMNFWVFVAFVGFLGSAFRPLKTHLLNVLDAHSARIQEGFHEAENMRQEAENLLQNTQEKHFETSLQIKEIYELAHQETLYLQEKMEEEKKFYMTLKEQMLTRRVSHNLEKVQQEIRGYLVRQVLEEVEKTLRASIDREVFQDASVPAFLQRFKKALKHLEA